MSSTRLLCLLLTFSFTLVAAHDVNTIQINGKSCSPTGCSLLSNSPGRVDSLDVCADMCEVSSQCESVTFFAANKSCSHFRDNCANLMKTDGAITITPQANPWTLVAYGRECQGETAYLNSSSQKQESLLKCIASCDVVSECNSITFFLNKFCSHFSTTCEHTKATAKAISMVKLARKQTICDIIAGEVYRSQSSGKVSDLAACKKSCEDDAGCKSITYFESGWCSHFSTGCMKRKFAADAWAIGLKNGM